MNTEFNNLQELNKTRIRQQRLVYYEDVKTKCEEVSEDCTETYCFLMRRNHQEMVKARGFNVPQAEEKR